MEIDEKEAAQPRLCRERRRAGDFKQPLARFFCSWRPSREVPPAGATSISAGTNRGPGRRRTDADWLRLRGNEFAAGFLFAGRRAAEVRARLCAAGDSNAVLEVRGVFRGC